LVCPFCEFLGNWALAPAAWFFRQLRTSQSTYQYLGPILKLHLALHAGLCGSCAEFWKSFDFSTFYAGAKLAHTPALYNHEIVRQTVQAGWPDSPEQEVYLRAPFYAVLLSPLRAFPYRTALFIFTCLTVAAFYGS
jgi:hypothetical protein